MSEVDDEITKLALEDLKKLSAGTNKLKLKPKFVGSLQVLQPATDKHKSNGHYRDFSLLKKAHEDKLRYNRERIARSLRIAQEKKEKEDAAKL